LTVYLSFLFFEWK